MDTPNICGSRSERRDTGALATGDISPTAIAPAGAPTAGADLRDRVFSLTGRFESGGRLDALNTYDSGIVSFGRHQATLASGALYHVVCEFLRRASGRAATALETFLPEVKRRAPGLRTDAMFHEALRTAAAQDPRSMAAAQDQVFSDLYYEPAFRSASRSGLRSPLAIALLFDTAVQGGLRIVLDEVAMQFERADDQSADHKFANRPAEERIARALRSGRVSEAEILRAFVERRRAYLLRVAHGKERAGDRTTAAALRASVHTRIAHFERLLQDEKAALQ